MIIDTHAHLMFEEFDVDREDVFRRAREASIGKIVNVGCGILSSKQSVEMVQIDRASGNDFLYATVGLHPYDAADLSEELIEEWEKWIMEDSESVGGKCIVAIGETGLDYVKSKVLPEVQKKSFFRHLELAGKFSLPVIVHNRGANEDCLRILDEFNNGGDKSGVKAVFHCFGSDLAFARRVWKAGYFTSFTGIITYPSAGDLREVVKEVPMDKFLVETDCPYLAPQAYRGKRNEPAYVVEVLKCIAEVKGIGFEEVEKAAEKNTFKFFNLASS